jgi:NAD(P)-dependent dehydrogenase (short-subunit alcohol dehydrogenase family)
VDKVIIVTGGSRGIGAATARLAAERGYAVCVNYRKNRAAADALVSEIQAAGAKALAVGADVASEADVVRLFETVDARLGVLTALVNNAGILETQTRVEHIDAARIDRVFATNVRGVFLCAREAVRRMSTAHGGAGGAIVNLSSRAAQLGAPGEYVDYAASKAAIEALTIGLAREVAGEGIRVNGVRPGIIYSEIHADGGEPGRVDRLGPTLPMRRGGEAIEVARAILWLLSDEASYSTASFIDVAGGR